MPLVSAFDRQRQGNYCKLEDRHLVSSRLSRVSKGDPSSIKKRMYFYEYSCRRLIFLNLLIKTGVYENAGVIIWLFHVKILSK